MACGFEAAEACEWGNSSLSDEFGVVYLKNMPRDPFFEKGWKYVYEVDEKRQKYTLYIVLEVKSDKTARANLTVECAPGLQCNWYVKN
jgi:hypothetical protein